MQAVNRFLYGPTPEEKVKSWQTKIRSEQRQLDREMRQVGFRLELLRIGYLTHAQQWNIHSSTWLQRKYRWK